MKITGFAYKVAHRLLSGFADAKKTSTKRAVFLETSNTVGQGVQKR